MIMDAYAIAKQRLGQLEQRLGQFCTTSCSVTVEGALAAVKNCRIQCQKATLFEVTVRYTFDLKKGSKVKAIVEVYKGTTKVGSGSWTHETPGWCWGQIWTDWCGIDETRTIRVSNVRPGDSLTVKLRVISG
jgi:hypothetical protein